MTSSLDCRSLHYWLEANIPGFAPPLSATKFAAGQSNPTYRIDAASGSYVLRRKPAGNLLPSAHAIDREYRLLSALSPTGFPVPRPIALCQDPEILGADFYVMALVDGTSYCDGTLPGMSPAERRSVYFEMVDTLARLHRIDVGSVGLSNFGKSTGFFERQVRRWVGQYRHSETECIEDMERLIEWLPRHIPPQDRSTIVHGDYRIDNLIFDTTARVSAVLDWELSTLGDPLADFAYFALQWKLPADGSAALGGCDFAGLGIPTLGEITARYCSASGITMLPDLSWHFAYNFFRLAAIVQGIKKRVAEGTASNADAASIVSRIPMLAAEGVRQIARTE